MNTPKPLRRLLCLLALSLSSLCSAASLEVKLDPAKTGEPISPYIYGQFIEHLGRCIYGGIWAEMLEDRKFFRPVGAAASPWQPLGGATVQMETEAPFVGDHTPRVTLPGG